MLPFLVGVSNVHEISELPMQPEILKVPLHMHEWIGLNGWHIYERRNPVSRENGAKEQNKPLTLPLDCNCTSLTSLWSDTSTGGLAPSGCKALHATLALRAQATLIWDFWSISWGWKPLETGFSFMVKLRLCHIFRSRDTTNWVDEISNIVSFESETSKNGF